MRPLDPKQILSAPLRVVQAFPWTIFAAALLCASLVVLNHSSRQDPGQVLSRMAMASGWGVSLWFLAEILAARMRGWGGRVLRLAPPVVLGLWFALVEHPMGAVQWSQFSLFAVATHLAVALAGGSDRTGFWQWNRLLLQRSLEAAAFSLALGGGISGAMWTFEKVFSVRLPSDSWGDVWIFVWSIFSTFHFLSGIRADAPEGEDSYPTYLKMFSTRVLLPLAMLYMALLYVYLAKILVTWSLPEGFVSGPVLAFAGLGILAQLLLHPLAARESDRWVRLWTRWFHVLLLPLCGLLAVAIGRRLRDYGLTEERYAVAVLAAWLPVQGIWFLSGRRGLRFVPASLMVLCLLCGWGPWGAFEASRRSQVSRLDAKLAAIGAVPGARTSKEVPRSTAKAIGEIVEYLCENHQGRGLEKWSPSVERIRRRADRKESNRYGEGEMADSVLASIGLPHVRRWEEGDSSGRKVILQFQRSGPLGFSPRTRLEDLTSTDSAALGRDLRLRIVREDHVLVFPLDTLGRLAGKSSGWKTIEGSLALRDSAGAADLVLRQATLRHRDHEEWRVESVEGLLLR